jgi:hypothetical protein
MDDPPSPDLSRFDPPKSGFLEISSKIKKIFPRPVRKISKRLSLVSPPGTTFSELPKCASPISTHGTSPGWKSGFSYSQSKVAQMQPSIKSIGSEDSNEPMSSPALVPEWEASTATSLNKKAKVGKSCGAPEKNDAIVDHQKILDDLENMILQTMQHEQTILDQLMQAQMTHEKFMATLPSPPPQAEVAPESPGVETRGSPKSRDLLTLLESLKQLEPSAPVDPVAKGRKGFDLPTFPLPVSPNGTTGGAALPRPSTGSDPGKVLPKGTMLLHLQPPQAPAQKKKNKNFKSLSITPGSPNSSEASPEEQELAAVKPTKPAQEIGVLDVINSYALPDSLSLSSFTRVSLAG